MFGSRNCGEGNIQREQSRSICSSIIKSFILAIIRLPIKDTQCGAKVFKREMAPILFGSAFKSKWLFDVEVFLKMKRYFGKKSAMNHMKEQPLAQWIHAEDSKLNAKDALKMPMKLLTIWYNYGILDQFRLLQNQQGFVYEDAAIEIVQPAAIAA